MNHTNKTLRSLLAALCLFFAARAFAYDINVAQDGSGDYTSVQAAILAAPDFSAARTRIFIKAGTYYEKIAVPKQKHRVTLIGEDAATTILTYDQHATTDADGNILDTTDTPSIYIKGKDFGARNLTFANTAGNVGPALAASVVGNRAHFRDCIFQGYQDTLYTSAKLAYFKRCYIEGAIDFVFGDGTAVFQKCTLRCLGAGYLTAADTRQGQAYGYVFKGCKISGGAPAGSVYLGRPWGDYANVVYLNCSMDDEIVPEGWDDWDDVETHSTAFYAEYDSTGAGADPADRVAWSHQITAQEEGNYTLGSIFHLSSSSAAGTVLTALQTPWYEAY